MIGINIIQVESKTQNPVLIRMNCLALACLDGRVGNDISDSSVRFDDDGLSIESLGGDGILIWISD